MTFRAWWAKSFGTFLGDMIIRPMRAESTLGKRPSFPLMEGMARPPRSRAFIFSTLEKAGIRYDYSVTGSTDPGKVREGFSGLSFHHAAQLRVFVRPADYEEALYLVRKAVREAEETE